MSYNDVLKFSCLVIIMTAAACSNGAKKKIYKPLPEVSSFESPGNIIMDTAGAKKFNSFKQVPSFIKKYLDSLTGGKYLIANPGQPFSKGCSSFEEEPTRQLIWAAMNKNLFQMQYWQGGIALFKSLLTIHLNENKITGYTIE